MMLKQNLQSIPLLNLQAIQAKAKLHTIYYTPCAKELNIMSNASQFYLMLTLEGRQIRAASMSRI